MSLVNFPDSTSSLGIRIGRIFLALSSLGLYSNIGNLQYVCVYVCVCIDR